MDCSGISYREITSPHIEFHIVSEALSSESVYHKYPLLFLWQVLENEKPTKCILDEQPISRLFQKDGVSSSETNTETLCYIAFQVWNF